MKSYKIILILSLIISTGLNAYELGQEYKVELLIYKYKNIKTTETFNSYLKIPENNIIELYDDSLDLNVFSNFSNISDYVSSILNNDINSLDLYPNTWFRESNNLDILNKLKKNIIKDNKLIFLNSKSWIQTIPDYETSQFLHYQHIKNDSGFYIKFYKKRFIHINLKGYLGNTNNDLSIYLDKEQRVFSDQVYLFDHPYFGIVVSLSEI